MQQRHFFRKILGLFGNPVLYKELSIGLRDRRIFIVQTIYLTILTVALFMVLMESLNNSYYSAADIGKHIFWTLFVIQFMLVVLIAPSLTCGSVTVEKEKKTYELLIGTLLTPSEIISGKLIHGVSHIFLLLVSSLPLTATVFFLGGISPLQLILGYLVIFAAGSICCQIGEFFSVRETKTANATNQSYLMIILFAIGAMPAIGALISYYQSSSASPLAYKTWHFPLWLFLGINFVIFSGFLFYKTVNYVNHQARNILKTSGFFIFGHLFNLTIFSALVANGTPSKEDIGIYFAMITVANLVLMGFFGSPSTFSSQRENQAFRRSLLSHPYFFSLFFTLAFVIPTAFFSFELPPGNRLDTLTSWYFHGFYIIVFYLMSRTLFKIFREKLPFAFFYYLLLIVLSFLPYISFIKEPQIGTTVPFMGFQFLSPPIVMYSLWNASTNYPESVDFLGRLIPIHLLSILAYMFILILMAIIFFHFRRGRQETAPGNQ